MLMIESEQISECFSAFGRRGVPAERVAIQLVQEVRDYLQAGVPVGQHLADQLLLPMALAGTVIGLWALLNGILARPLTGWGPGNFQPMLALRMSGGL